MARPQRIEYPGAFYHVTNRGNRKQAIFRSDDDRFFFLNCLREAYERHGLICHVYCLMDNHFHLFVETPRGNLSRAMHAIDLKYASYFNLKHSLEGHTFQGRFQAILVQAEEYAREVASYIHLNPVRARLVERPEDYRWSNYRMYLGSVPPEPWTTCLFILALFGDSLPVARWRYDRYIVAQMNVVGSDPLEPARRTGILGGPEFIDGIGRSDLQASKVLPEKCDARPGLGPVRPSLREIQDAAVDLCGGESRLSRKIAIFVAHKDTDLPLSIIGEFFSIGESGIADVCRRLRKELACNETLAGTIREVELRLKRGC